MGYPDITKKALCKFSTESAESKALEKAPIVIRRPQKKLIDTKPIYIPDSGMVPHYTGHVPGNFYSSLTHFNFLVHNDNITMSKYTRIALSSFINVIF